MRACGRTFRYEKVEVILSQKSLLRRMLQFEAALAMSEGELRLIPQRAASIIAACCRVELVDTPALLATASKAGNLAIPLIGQLTKLVREADPEAARYVHWGATSQDVIDTALVLQSQDAIRLIAADLDRSSEALAHLTREHRNSCMAGRTWLQHAAPITFGLKTASMLSSLMWHKNNLRRAAEEISVLQFGGSVGTLAGLGENGIAVAESVARKLGLKCSTIPWHSQRERIANLAVALGIMAGSFGKIARDISLLTQTEVGEISEPWEEGRGGSSTMPQKRNPVNTALVLSLTTQVPGIVSTSLSAMIQEHERGLGGWQAEWEVIPDLISTTAAISHHSSHLLAGIKVNASRMRANLELGYGTIYAEIVSMKLADKVGKPEAQRLVSNASTQAIEKQLHLKSILLKDPAITAILSASEIDALFDPSRYLGSANAFIDSVLAQYESERRNALR